MINKVTIPLKDPITSSSDILSGTPVIKGTRLPASLVFKLLSNGYTTKTIRLDYPQLTMRKVNLLLKLMSSSFNVSPKV